MKEITASLEEIDKVVEYINSTIPSSAIIFLVGDLASGKTTLTTKVAKTKGIEGDITSPTFSLQQCYRDDFFHYDLYRIENHEFMELGLFEEFEKEGWHFVEWGDDKLKSFLLDVGYTLFSVEITPYEDRRKYIIKKHQ